MNKPPSLFEQIRLGQALKQRGQTTHEREEELFNGVMNVACDWLTYETIFNQSNFRKSNQRCEMGLFKMGLSSVQIILTPHLPLEMLMLLGDAFIVGSVLSPMEKAAVLVEKAMTCCSYLHAEGSFDFVLPPSNLVMTPKQESIPGSGVQDHLHLEPVVVLPYNYLANTQESKAIGTRSSTRGLNGTTRIVQTWSMWKTASRSCVVELKPYSKVDVEREPWPPGGTELVTPDVVAGKEAFQLPRLSPQHFSLKTGVEFIGKSGQGSLKSVIDRDIYYGCLQSASLRMIQHYRNHSNAKDGCLSFLFEVMAIREDCGCQMEKNGYQGDGVLIRDLSALNPAMLHFPPISIPFVGGRLDTFQPRYAGITEVLWRDFWMISYAAALGRAKALLMVRYGLQMMTPNAQNFLIEMADPGAPTGKILMRDIGDAAFLTGVFFKVNCKPVKIKNLSDHLKKPELHTPELHMIYDILSASDHDAAAICTHWHDYSALTKGSSVASPGTTSPDPDADAPGWPLVLATMAEWGLAHAMAYVAVVCALLPERANQIDWRAVFASYPHPDGYRLLDESALGVKVQVQQIHEVYMAWEKGLDALLTKLVGWLLDVDTCATRAWTMDVPSITALNVHAALGEPRAEFNFATMTLRLEKAFNSSSDKLPAEDENDEDWT